VNTMCDFANLDQRWLCVQVRVGCEIRSALGLRERGYESFVPVYGEKRRWSDRVKTIQVPLFTGYVFFRFCTSNANAVITTPGVIRFVGAGKMPLPVDDSEIEALQLTVRSGLRFGPCAFLEIGQEVEVHSGVLTSVRGRIVRFKNKERLILSVNLIQRSMFVEVDGCEIACLKPQSSSGQSNRDACSQDKSVDALLNEDMQMFSAGAAIQRYASNGL
jgi:transcription termination/antitermination protein NusG